MTAPDQKFTLLCNACREVFFRSPAAFVPPQSIKCPHCSGKDRIDVPVHDLRLTGRLDLVPSSEDV